MTATFVSPPIHTGLASERLPAMNEFDLARSRGLRRRIWKTLTRRPSCLLNLHEITENLALRGQSDEGLQIVPIELIRGTVNRDGEFSSDFDPLRVRSRQRWANIAHARLNGVALPPVTLIRVGDTYFVEDGHHRISVANHFGQEEIDASVTVLQVEAST